MEYFIVILILLVIIFIIVALCNYSILITRKNDFLLYLIDQYKDIIYKVIDYEIDSKNYNVAHQIEDDLNYVDSLTFNNEDV